MGQSGVSIQNRFTKGDNQKAPSVTFIRFTLMSAFSVTRRYLLCLILLVFVFTFHVFCVFWYISLLAGQFEQISVW